MANDDKRRENKPDNALNNPDEQLIPTNDPAIINPVELATFPKQKKNEDPDLEEERENHMTNRKQSAVRSGRNITNTSDNPEKDSYM
ncbi:hypothetical protein Q763_14405 [Flavobacterium beibuense F44-8]|uniref:Uncharacterized protein n=1 Tax=Flavobacterium beibuense F44-8 TaxID=1406840 RepID=A0A0A2LSV3_9FLAO|nr:hypothetical protein [Flavobacterium beibuense]KGO79230.1 hypothetical protein Q763_14405 [Flavobacterium beibuense F44-8]